MKKLLALLMAIILFVSTPTGVMAAEPSTLDANVPSVWTEGENGGIATASDLYIMATYYDTSFYIQSLIKEVYLENPCIKITYRCTTEDGTYDSMHLIITDLNGGGYDKYLYIEGDGASHTMALYLPAGRYKVHFEGNINHHHTAAAVNFKGYV